jgi:hypothetical protein
MRVLSLEKPQLPPLVMPDRFKMEIVFFMTPAGDPGVPPLGPGEYWIRLGRKGDSPRALCIAV